MICHCFTYENCWRCKLKFFKVVNVTEIADLTLKPLLGVSGISEVSEIKFSDTKLGLTHYLVYDVLGMTCLVCDNKVS